MIARVFGFLVGLARIVACIVSVLTYIGKGPVSTSSPSQTSPLESSAGQQGAKVALMPTSPPTLAAAPTPPPSPIPTNTPASTDTPVPTRTPLPTLTPTATLCPPGCVLYETSWSDDSESWPKTGDWQTISGMLVNNGSNEDAGSWIAAPYELNAITNYAVEADIEVVRTTPHGPACRAASYGIVSRAEGGGAYWLGVKYD